MAWRWPWQKVADPIVPEVRRNPDGSVTTTHTMTLSAGNVRPVRDDVVSAIDDALAAHGRVLHAMDPSRIVSFEHGGPPVWSVGMAQVGQDWLCVTYGLSHVLSPEPIREGVGYELSLRVPGEEPPVWAPALLRHLARYVLRTGAELRVNDTMPLGWPVTRVAFAAEHHAGLPNTPLDAIVVAADPLVPRIDTAHGPIEVRRLVGLHPDEVALIDTWSSRGFLGQWAPANPQLTTDPARPSAAVDEVLWERITALAREEGGSVGAVFVTGGWTPDGDSGAVIQLPGGPQAAQLRRVLDARLPYGRPLLIDAPPPGSPVQLVPSDGAFSIEVSDEGVLVVAGPLDHPAMAGIVDTIRTNTSGTQIRIGS